jgi:hypothetical protein
MYTAGGAATRRSYRAAVLHAGFKRVRSTIVPGFAFRMVSTRDSAGAYGVKAVLYTAQR